MTWTAPGPLLEVGGWTQSQARMTHPPAASGYVPSLDGLRAVSILVVFVSHVGFGDIVPGGFGVTVFFFLSGYLITTLLCREFAAYGRISLRAFYLRRLVRLGPPLIVTLAFATALGAAGLVGGAYDPGILISQIFFYYNYYVLAAGGSWIYGLEILWSLSIEEHFYIVWPALFMGLALADPKTALRTLAGLLVAALVWRVVRHLVFGADEWTIYISTDTRFDSLIYGCLLAFAQWRGAAARLFPDGLGRNLLILASLVLLLASFVIRDPTFRSTLRYSLQGVALLPIFHYAVTRPELWVFRPLNWAPVRRLGVYSYTFYLVHFVLVGVVTTLGLGEPRSIALFVLAGGGSTLFAAAVHRWAERPLKPLRARLTGHDERRA